MSCFIGRSCGEAVSIEHGTLIHLNGTKYEGVLKYVCEEGYLLHGDETRQCQADGQWDGELPLCKSEQFFTFYFYTKTCFL